jgi:hypothetical protein
LHLNYPFAGSRMLRQQGIDVGRLHVATLMRKMGIEAIYRRPRTSKPAPGQRIWRTIKYEEVYLRAYESVQDARTSLGRHIEFYNRTRPHCSLKGKTPIRSTATNCHKPWQPNQDRTSHLGIKGICSNKPSHYSLDGRESYILCKIPGGSMIGGWNTRRGRTRTRDIPWNVSTMASYSVLWAVTTPESETSNVAT